MKAYWADICDLNGGLPFEHGHWAHGRWAENRGANPSEITTNQSDRISGMANYYTGKVSVEKA